MKYGATPLAAGGVQFRVWAPSVARMSIRIVGSNSAPFEMVRCGDDFEVFLPAARPGDLYWFVLDGTDRPDPCSRSQPKGVHGPSEIVDPESFAWTDSNWIGPALRDYIFYELHVGTFTSSGTFNAIVPKLSYLKELGITAIELMPAAQFSGDRNWGYDGVDLYAPHAAYGGPAGLKRLVDEAHAAGLAIVLDVVYNHLGPEGNYLANFGPYFTSRYQTPWGSAINFDGSGSDGVRRFFIDNALYWLKEYHVDALRLDAIHSIFDFSALHILSELQDRFHREAERLSRQAFLIAESDLNDVRVVQPRELGGYAIDAQWHDEFHHAVFSMLTGADCGYLGDFGELKHVQKAIQDGFVYDGIYSAYRQRRFGSFSRNEPGERFVAFLQNHDQVANTSQGIRLSTLTSHNRYEMAVMLLLCSPFLPLLFMGEEFADVASFLYFTSYGDRALAKAVTEGRRNEVAAFGAEFADPQSLDTFEESKVNWAIADQPGHCEVLRLYRDLITLRKRWPCLGNCRKDLTRVTIDEKGGLLSMERADPAGSRGLLLCNFSSVPAEFPTKGPAWKLALCTGVQPTGGDRGVTMSAESSALFLAP